MLTSRCSSNQSLLVVLLLFSVSIPQRIDAVLTEAEKATMLRLHNEARASVSPTATAMLKMYWDDDIAASAQQYADTCPGGHSGYANLGENLSWGAPSLAAARAVELWNNEIEFYTYSPNSCQSGEQCGHYTQVTWANTQLVGCGVKICDSIDRFDWNGPIYAYVCQYRSPGNYVGQRPWVSGQSCSDCPEGFTCQNNLCIDPDLEGTDTDLNSTEGGSGTSTTDSTSDDDGDGGDGDGNGNGDATLMDVLSNDAAPITSPLVLTTSTTRTIFIGAAIIVVNIYFL